MHEVEVTLTDYLLVAENACFVWLLCRQASGWRQGRKLFALFFGSAAVGALAGGTVHGFFPDDTSLAGGILWKLAMLALGVAAFSAWALGAAMLFRSQLARFLQAAAALETVVYGGIVLLGNAPFRIAVVNYVPAVLFLLIAFVAIWTRKRQVSLMLGPPGPVLVLVASCLQQRHVSVDPSLFNYNVLYHVLQAIAIFMVFWTAWRLTSADLPPRSG